MWLYSEFLDHTYTVFETCGSVRIFLITPSVMFSTYEAVFGTSWSHLYCFRNMWQYSELLDHTFYTVFEICGSIRNFLNTPVLFFRNMLQYSELLDHTFSTLFGICDSIRWRNLTIDVWRMAPIDVDFWTLRPGLNPMSIRVGFVMVKKVVLRHFILWALRLCPISHRQCTVFTRFQPLWKTFLEKNVTVRQICRYICGLVLREQLFMCVTVLWTEDYPISKNF